MRVVDIYRREGDKLAENWIFIDIPHFSPCRGSTCSSGCGRSDTDVPHESGFAALEHLLLTSKVAFCKYRIGGAKDASNDRQE